MAGEHFAGLGVSALGLFNQRRNLRDQRDIQTRSFNETRRANRERERLAKATRTDAFGNRIVYNAGTGFEVELDPLTEAILNAQQKEQLASLREDAPRNRQAAERKDRRSRFADEAFEEDFARSRSRRQRSEKEFEAEAIRDALLTRAFEDRDADNDLARLALRVPNSGSARSLIRESRRGRNDHENIAEAIVNAKRRGRGEFFAVSNAEDNQERANLSFLNSIANDTAQSPVQFSNVGDRLSGQNDAALQQLIAVLGQNSQLGSQAFRELVGTLGNRVDFREFQQKLNDIEKQKEFAASTALSAYTGGLSGGPSST